MGELAVERHLRNPSGTRPSIYRWGRWAACWLALYHSGIDPILAGITLGLLAGNALGITAASAHATRLGLAGLPDAVTWLHLASAATTAGIGFTVSLFIGGLAFDAPTSITASALGATVLLRANHPPTR